MDFDFAIPDSATQQRMPLMEMSTEGVAQNMPDIVNSKYQTCLLSIPSNSAPCRTINSLSGFNEPSSAIETSQHRSASLQLFRNGVETTM